VEAKETAAGETRGYSRPPRVRKLKGFLGAPGADGLRTLYTTHALDEGVSVREEDILDYLEAEVDADGLQQDVLLVHHDAVIIKWSVEERRQDFRVRRGGNGFDDGK
jgi:hypothetical protein